MKPYAPHTRAWLLTTLLLLSSCVQAQSEPAEGRGAIESLTRWLKRATDATEAIENRIHGVPRKAPRGAQPELIAENGCVTWDGKPLALGAPVAEWWKVLGPPSRQDRFGKMQAWDHLGILLTTDAHSYLDQLYTDISKQISKSDAPLSSDSYEKYRPQQQLDEAKQKGVFKVEFVVVSIRPEPGPDVDEDGNLILRQAFKGYLQVNGIGIDNQSTLREVSRWSEKSSHPLSFGCLRLDELRRCSASNGMIGATFDVDRTEQRNLIDFAFFGDAKSCTRPTP
ncbi:hypothetical protein ACCM60_18990 [Pseudomonas chlororaphis subsp. aureofaciens]|uniref:DUF7738 domain-containing protein n=1 Tax=Pseudomonas chlororaphis TaxID=587753 RepID=UPI003558B0C0